MTTIQFKRGTAAAIASTNPTPAAGEAILETDTGRIKFGDGSTDYNSLPYQVDPVNGGNASMTYGGITTTTNSTVTYTAISGSNVPVVAGFTYEIRYRLRTYSAANTTGMNTRRVLGGGAAGNVLSMHTWFPSSLTAGYTRASREGTNDPALGTGNATSSTSAAAGQWIDVLFECTTSGTFGLEMASEVASSLVTVDGDGSTWVAISRKTTL